MQDFDSLLEENPFVQKKKAESLAEGVAIGKEEGQTEGFQRAVISLVEERFPPLVELAQQKVIQIRETDRLNRLFKGVVAATNEETVRLLIEILAA